MCRVATADQLTTANC